jgi:hypothetical protein
MILQERNVPPFGGRVTDIDNKTFLCVVTTAKNSLFEGLSTIVHHHSYGEVAKLFYNDRLSKSYRQRLHSNVCQIIDTGGEAGKSLGDSIQDAIDALKSKDLLEFETNTAKLLNY